MTRAASIHSCLGSRWATLATLAVLGSACGHSTTSPVGPVRFQNQAPVWRVNDQRDTPKQPKERKTALDLYHFDGYITVPLMRSLDVLPAQRSRSVNSLGEVPDSTWFENRIGARTVSAEEITRGPRSDEDAPEKHKPWTITGTKIGGQSVGFVVKDSRGQKYILKPDLRSHPEMESGAHVVVHRLLWAFGYNVPEDDVVYFTPEELRLADDATVKDVFGNERPMTQADLDERLALVGARPKEQIRGLISRYLPGMPIGGFARQGVRPDDPNDVIPHEHRRELRGMYVVAAWLGHTDIKETNTLDIWLEDKAQAGKHYVRHYLIDFGKALGVMGKQQSSLESGHTHSLDFGVLLQSAVTLGLWRKSWETQKDPALPGIGLFAGTHYNPGAWKPEFPWVPFSTMDRFDAYWAAKTLMRFTPTHIRAAVNAARFSDPRSVRYLTATLIDRQRKTGAYWFRQVAPLDYISVEPGRDSASLCFVDLLRFYDLDSADQDGGASTRYVAAAYSHGGVPMDWKRVARPDGRGRACLSRLVAGPDHDGYVIVQLRTYRGDTALPPVDVHLARNPAGELHVIGVWRHEHSRSP